MAIESINPATGELVERFDELDAAGVDAALARAVEAFEDWKQTPFDVRAGVLRCTAGLLREEADEHARVMAVEMGKPVTQGRGEAEKCAWVCDYYAENGERFLSPEAIETDAERSYVRFDPIGPVLAVMPWNFPYWQVFRFAAPAVMAGNAGLLKHASNVPRSGLNVADLLSRAGLPEGVFQTLLLSARRAGELVDRPEVRALTLTGSEPAGRSLAERAGRNLKKTVLELGGSDPFVVLDDVDAEAVARSAASARTINAGQSCIAAKRFIVMEAVADRFVEAFRRALEALRVGDPLDPETEIGPMAREDLLDELDDQVRRSVDAGARLLLGGKRLARPGAFYPPTLLDHVSPDMTAGCEETFGPVAAVLRVASEEEAVAVANASRFGLGASLWSGDSARAEALVPRIDAGCVFVNGIVKSDPRLPFGGVKDSGYGRELADFGIREFVNIKTAWVGNPA